MSHDFDRDDDNAKSRSSHPFSFLTEEDMEELDRLDLPLGEYQAWMWNRGVRRMTEAIFSASAHPENTESTGAEESKLPRINYHDWWRSEQEAKIKRRKAWSDAARHAAKQEAKRAERESEEFKALDAVNRERALRLKLLRAGTKNPGGDKRVEQLHGQEEVYVKTWRATQLACREYGPGASAAKIAEVYIEHYSGEAVTRHQIRARGKVILELEKPGGIWAPDKLIGRLEKG